MSDLTPRNVDPSTDIANPLLVRKVNRDLDRVRARTLVTQARIRAKAEEAATVIRAQNALGAVAMQADEQLSALAAALPLHTATDADFRSQVQAAVRAKVLGDLYGGQL